MQIRDASGYVIARAKLFAEYFSDHNFGFIQIPELHRPFHMTIKNKRYYDIYRLIDIFDYTSALFIKFPIFWNWYSLVH